MQHLRQPTELISKKRLAADTWLKTDTVFAATPSIRSNIVASPGRTWN